MNDEENENIRAALDVAERHVADFEAALAELRSLETECEYTYHDAYTRAVAAGASKATAHRKAVEAAWAPARRLYDIKPKVEYLALLARSAMLASAR